MTAADARVLTWSNLETDHPMDLIDRQRILGDRMMISRVRLHPGFVVEQHQHENEQFVVMLSGKARFHVGGFGDDSSKEVMLEGGQVLVLPANVPHSCEAIDECLVLDLFSPVSQGTGVDAHTKK